MLFFQYVLVHSCGCPGAIPVIIDDKITLPFCSVLDWRRFSVRLRARDVGQLPNLLRAIPRERVLEMQRRLAEVRRRYFLFPFHTALAVLQLRVQEALRKEQAARVGAGRG